MDLGIFGKRAIICAASRGLGKACAMALVREGVNVIINGRDANVLQATKKEIAAIDKADVTAIACDITTQAGQEKILEACPHPDILVNNAGGPPPGDFRDWDTQIWQDALQANMLTPVMLIKAVIDHMIAQKFGRIVNITSGAVKSPIAILGLSNAARCGLSGFVAGLSRQVAQHNVAINNLLPGPFDTDRLQSNIAHIAETSGKSVQEERATRMQANPAGRFGQPEELGQMCAYLCSQQAGFIVGQNILMDGGSFNGTL
ncbi:MAG: SDR family oxidoreductase [Pseudomonadota bacterium]